MRENRLFCSFPRAKIHFFRNFSFWCACVEIFHTDTVTRPQVKSIASDVFFSFLAFLSCFETVVEASAQGKSFVKFAFGVALKFLVESERKPKADARVNESENC